MAFSSNALSAKAKTMYGERIKQEDYLELCKKQSIGDVVTYLKNQDAYSEILADINVNNIHRRQVEVALNKVYFNRCAKLMKYAPKNEQEFYLKEIMSIEMSLIVDKVLSIKENDSKIFSLEIPEHLANKMSYNIYGLLNVDTYKELIEYFVGTKYYKILSEFDFSGSIDFNALDNQLANLYYDDYVKSIKKIYSGRTQKLLLEILYTAIELKNISRIYRLKKYFNQPREAIEPVLMLKYNRIAKETMNQLLDSKDIKEFMNILANSSYQLLVDEQEYVYIEYYVEKIHYNLARKYMRFSNEASLVYMTYCILQDVEIDNLKHIIEGIRYGKDASSIENMLICT